MSLRERHVVSRIMVGPLKLRLIQAFYSMTYFAYIKSLEERSVNFHLCSCSRYVEAGILVSMYFRIPSCGPFVIIFSKIL